MGIALAILHKDVILHHPLFKGSKENQGSFWHVYNVDKCRKGMNKNEYLHNKRNVLDWNGYSCHDVIVYYVYAHQNSL